VISDGQGLELSPESPNSGEVWTDWSGKGPTDAEATLVHDERFVPAFQNKIPRYMKQVIALGAEPAVGAFLILPSFGQSPRR
jgi:hypothetical protein